MPLVADSSSRQVPSLVVGRAPAVSGEHGRSVAVIHHGAYCLEAYSIQQLITSCRALTVNSVPEPVICLHILCLWSLLPPPPT